MAAVLLLALVAGAPAHAHSLDAQMRWRQAYTRLTEMSGQPLVGGPVRTATRATPQARSAEATPKADCGPGSRPEPGMQGRVPRGPAATRGFTCNTELVGKQGRSAGFKVLRFKDRAGRECAYYDTTLLFPSNAQHLSTQPTGVAVLDMSNPSKPVQTATLSTPAMQTPHESVVLNQRRGLLAAVMGSPVAHPGHFDIYDLNEDCRHPALQASAPVGLIGHESGFAPDGRTFYASSIGTGQVTAIDVSNPRLPVPLWVGHYQSHGLTISEDGNRAYLADLNGLIILDVSEINARKLNPQAREVSRLSWPNITIPQNAIPVTIDGKPFVVEVDEYSSRGGTPLPETHGPRVGAARIIDISNERAPRVVSNIRLEVHEPQNRDAIRGDPGASSMSTQGYAAHYCEVPQRSEPGIVACSFIASGLRVFDIRDPYKPKEIAYFTSPLTHSSTAGEPSNWAMSAPAFAPERGEIWYSDGNTGFYAVRATNGVWPFGGGRRSAARKCLNRRSPIGPRNIGRVRLGRTRAQLERRILPASRGRHVYRFCVKRSSARVTAVFSKRSARGRARLVISTARRHGMRGVHRGSRVGRLLRRFQRARRIRGVRRGLYRAGPRSQRIFGTRRGRIRFVGVADRKLLRSRKQLGRYLRRAGL